MKFKVAWQKGDKYLIKMGFDDGTEKWADTIEAVYNFAKKNFKPASKKDNYDGEECGFEYTEENGKFNVTRIIKGGKSTKKEGTTAKESSPATTKYACSDCGKELKDDKYKKCFVCNKKSPSKGGGQSYSKSPKDAEQIKRLSVLKSSCEAMVVLQGQVGDVEVLGEHIEILYDRLLAKVNG